ncbi:MAG TPA: efflux transporter outer membrane subunit [Thermoanaerobaculia bacterium]|nr:efflux transporter outer membrane subunit [Thermoanaerobaculia bacterium]
MRRSADLQGVSPMAGAATRGLGGLLAAACLAGCTVGPAYRRPPLTVPEQFYGQTGAAQAASLADLPWWEVFADPTLRSLIEEALRGGFDVRIAAARVEEARARFGIARAAYLPELAYKGEYLRQRLSELAQNPTGKATDQWTANVNTSWEIDVWGRIRRLNESAKAQYLATEEARRGVMLTLLGEVASAYFDLRQLDEELEIAHRTTAALQDTFDLFNRRLEGGAASALETSNAEALLAAEAAQVPVLESQITAKENQLALLLGRGPGPVPRGAPPAGSPPAGSPPAGAPPAGSPAAPPPRVPGGLPAALLLRRPDLRQAEQQLIAANANVGVARAAFLPTLSLTGLLGGVSPELSQLFAAGKTWSIGAGVAQPLVNAGGLRSQYRVVLAQWEQARLLYEQAVTNAFGEVSTALVTLQKLADAERERARSAAAYGEAVRLARLRYTSGLSAYFEVLDALRQLLAAENNLAQTRRDRSVALVQLYKALGGGWQIEDKAAVPAGLSGLKVGDRSELLEDGPDLGAVSDHHDQLPARGEVPLADARDVGCRHRLDLGDELAELLGREAVDPVGGEGAGEPSLPLVAQQVEAGLEAFGGGELLGARPRRAHAVELGEDLLERRRRDLVAHVGADTQEAPRLEGLERRKWRIAVALVLADVADQPAAERASENGVGDQCRVVVGIDHPGPRRADQEERLHRAGAVDEKDRAPGRARRRRSRGCGLAHALPTAEGGGDRLAGRGGVDVADDHQQRALGTETAREFALQDLGRDGGERLGSRCDDVVGMVPVERPREGLVAEELGRREARLQAGAGVGHRERDLTGGKRGVPRDVGEHVEDPLRARGESHHGDGDRVLAGAGGDLAAGCLELFGELPGGAGGGSVLDGFGQQLRNAGELARIGGAAAAHRQGGGQLRQAGTRGDPDGEPFGGGRASCRGDRQGRVRAEARQLLGQRLLLGHPEDAGREQGGGERERGEGGAMIHGVFPFFSVAVAAGRRSMTVRLAAVR